MVRAGLGRPVRSSTTVTLSVPPWVAVDPLADLDGSVHAAKRLEQPQLGSSVSVRDMDDPLPVRRPSGLEPVPVPERQLVGFPALYRQHVEIAELAAAARAVHDSGSVGRPLGPSPVKGLLPQDLGRVVHRSGRNRRTPDRTGTKRNAPVRDEDHLLAVRGQGRLDVQILAQVCQARSDFGRIRRVLRCKSLVLHGQPPETPNAVP